MAESTGARLDRLVSWALSALATIALFIGGWMFNTLVSQLDTLDDSVDKLTTNIAVIDARLSQYKELEAEVDELEERVRALETRP